MYGIYRDQNVRVLRDAGPGDKGYDPNVEGGQIVIATGDGSNRVINKNDVNFKEAPPRDFKSEDERNAAIASGTDPYSGIHGESTVQGAAPEALGPVPPGGVEGGPPAAEPDVTDASAGSSASRTSTPSRQRLGSSSSGSRSSGSHR